jgi:aspartate kinase
MTRIFKFGGGLMKDADSIRKVATLIAEYNGDPLVVVVSALGKTTNAFEELISANRKNENGEVERLFLKLRKFHFELAENLFGNARHQIFDELDATFVSLRFELDTTFPNRFMAYDQLICYGEQLSSTIIHHYLVGKGLKSHLLDARTLITTNSNYTAGKVDWKYTGKTIDARVVPVLENEEIVVTQGFIGADHLGYFTSLGREGSDFTAAVFAYALEAEEVSIWKDVPGLMNADPRVFDNSVKLDNISYHEAIELAFYGAQVVHPKTIQPVQQKNIPLYVRSFSDPSATPSVINDKTRYDDEVYKIIIKENQTLLSISSRDLTFIAEENLTRIFDGFAKNKIHVNLMQHSAVSFSVCFNGDEEKLESLIEALKDTFSLRYNTGLTLITVRHYNEEIIDQLTGGKKIYLEQKSRSTIQILVK